MISVEVKVSVNVVENKSVLASAVTTSMVFQYLNQYLNMVFMVT